MLQNRNKEFDDRSPALRQFDRVAMMARQAGMQDDPRVLKALWYIKNRWWDSDATQKVANHVCHWITTTPTFRAMQDDKNPFSYPPFGAVDGPIRFGRAHHPVERRVNPVGLFQHEANMNVLVRGRAGTGKTTMFLTLSRGFMKQKVPILFVDFKADYRCLIQLSDETLVFNRKTLKWNILKPPEGVDAESYINMFADIFFESFFSEVPHAGKAVFLDTATEFIANFRKEHDGKFPSLGNLQGYFNRQIEQPKGKQAYNRERLRTCQSRLNALQRVCGDMLDCSDGFSWEDVLLKKPVVIEIHDLPNEIAQFLGTLLLMFIFMYRISNAQRGRLEHMVFFDEARNIVPKSRASGTSEMARLLSAGRELGQGFCAADQIGSELGSAVNANVFTQIVLSQSSAKEINHTAYMLGLNKEQREFLYHIPVGTGVVKFADRWTRPFLAQFPCPRIRKAVPDEEVERHMAQHLLSLKYEPAVSDQEIIEVTVTRKSEPQDSGKLETERDEAHDNGLPFPWDSREAQYVMAVKSQPFVSITQRNSSLLLTTYMGNKISRILKKHDLVQEIVIHTGRRGGREKFFALTPKAVAIIGKQNLPKGKGGFEHVWWQHFLAGEYSQQGFEVEVEAFRNGKAADLNLKKNGRLSAIEIAMSAGGECSNFLKDHAAGWDRVISASRDTKIMMKIQKEWEQRKNGIPDDFVTFCLITDLVFDSNGQSKRSHEQIIVDTNGRTDSTALKRGENAEERVQF